VLTIFLVDSPGDSSDLTLLFHHQGSLRLGGDFLDLLFLLDFFVKLRLVLDLLELDVVLLLGLLLFG